MYPRHALNSKIKKQEECNLPVTATILLPKVECNLLLGSSKSVLSNAALSMMTGTYSFFTLFRRLLSRLLNKSKYSHTV